MPTRLEGDLPSSTPPLEDVEDLLTDSDDEGLPSGWDMRVTDKGRVFYVSHSDRHTQWQHPKNGKEKYLSPDLPFGWERGTDEAGQLIFVDHVNKRTTCVDPRLACSITKTKATSKFDVDSTAMAVLRGRDMRGKTALITGANSGIGFETARVLSLHGCHVVLLCRDKVKGDNAANRILKDQIVSSPVNMIQCDLSSIESVHACAKQFIKQKWPLHILVCNAAVMGIPFRLTTEGIEETFATNHLGHFLLSNLLKDVMKESSPSRVVVVSSESHRFPSLYGDHFDLTSLQQQSQNESAYNAIVSYNQSKLCNILFAFEFNRRFSKYGLHCNAVNPGALIHTRLQRNSVWYKTLFTLVRPFTKSKEQGASTAIFCATSHELEGVGGFYFNHCCGCQPSNIATNEKLALELWEYSEKLVRRMNLK